MASKRAHSHRNSKIDVGGNDKTSITPVKHWMLHNHAIELSGMQIRHWANFHGLARTISCMIHAILAMHQLPAFCQSTNKGVNERSKDVTQTQQHRPESPTATLTSKYKVIKTPSKVYPGRSKLHQSQHIITLI